MQTFLHFVVSLQSRFYTLALVFVFDMNISSPSLRLFKVTEHIWVLIVPKIFLLLSMKALENFY
jgi:hypothetical protein